MSYSALKKAALSLLRQLGNAVLEKVFSKPPEKSEPSPPEPPIEKIHPWRACGIGQHWVRTHPLSVGVSDKYPEGKTPRNGHCADNPVRTATILVRNKKTRKLIPKDVEHPPPRDLLTPHEIHLISNTYFTDLQGPPAAGKLPLKNGDQYDAFIRGWTRYWNDVLKPVDPLDPDLIKALMASESRFISNPEPQNAGASGMARGSMQVTDKAVKDLGSSNELDPHFIRVTQADMNDPDIAICAGIRWLFLSRQRASNKLKREATWREAIAEYKGYLKEMQNGKKPLPTGMRKLDEYYGLLKK